MWETNTFNASFHARLNVASGAVSAVKAGLTLLFAATNCHKFRNTLAGFWLSASNVEWPHPDATPNPKKNEKAA
jgi:hypothetical protein